MDWQSLSREECIKRLHSNAHSGLTPEQARQFLARFGPNRLQRQKRKSLLRRFLEQFSDFMVLILLAAAAISFLTSYVRGDSDYIDSIIILVIVTLNAVMGVVQESRAEKAIDALKKLSSPHSQVIRGGRHCTIPSEELVPGDVVRLQAGDLGPADSRGLGAHTL